MKLHLSARERYHLPTSRRSIMGPARGVIALLLAATPKACVAFVPPSFRFVSRATTWNKVPATSGGISSTVPSNAEACPTKRRARCAGYAPVMMAKAPKRGKGKAGRMDLIERCERWSDEGACRNGRLVDWIGMSCVNCNMNRSSTHTRYRIIDFEQLMLSDAYICNDTFPKT